MVTVWKVVKLAFCAKWPLFSDPVTKFSRSIKVLSCDLKFPKSARAETGTTKSRNKEMRNEKRKWRNKKRKWENEIESVGKLVHASQKLAHWHYIVSISCREKSWQHWYIVNLTVRTYSKPHYNKFEIEVDLVTWAVKTEPQWPGQLKNTIRADIRVR